MQTIKTSADLRSAIAMLEIQQAAEMQVMKDQFKVVYESIKPMNLIKNSIMEAVESPEIQDNFLNATVGITAGYISKLLFQGVTNNPLKKFMGTALMFGIKNVVAQNPEVVKSLGKSLFSLIKQLLGDRPETGKSDFQKPEDA